MTWTAVVLVRPESPDGPMVSRLPSYLHPVAGRPLIWHTVRSLMAVNPPPARVFVSGPMELPPEIFDGVGTEVHPLAARIEDPVVAGDELASDRPVIVLHASASFAPPVLRRLLDANDGDWLGASDLFATAIRPAPAHWGRIVAQDEPFSIGGGLLDPLRRLPDTGAFVVRNREELAVAQQRIRDEIVGALMRAGTTFILPDTVSVDVEVRIGRDTIVYPGVVLEGQTTIGEETVIGPGCRIIDSWVGSGVELKGWNYIAHTSVRNRAILEPYVRRGFD